MHIEIPDGVLPFAIWFAGFAITAILLVVAIYFAKKEEKKMPLAALLAALSLLVMSVPLGLPVHINLMVLVGILVGPFWALIVSFVTNSILASVGHGGVTVIGINTILLWSQALFGFLIFRAIKDLGGEKKGVKAIMGGLTAFFSLFLSFSLLAGLVFAVNLNPDEVLIHDHSHDHHSHDHEDEHYEEHHDEDEHYEDHHDEDEHHEDHHDEEHHEDEHHGAHDYYSEELSVGGFLAVALPLFLYAAIIEAIIVALVIGFLQKSRPDLL